MSIGKHDCSTPWLDCWSKLGQECDLVIVIAPEFDSILESTVAELRKQGCNVAVSDATYLSQSVDKWQTYQAWISNNVATPPTSLANAIRSTSDLRSLASHTDLTHVGWTVKRRDGAGCWQHHRWTKEQDLLVHLNTLEDRAQWIVQPWIEGTAASTSWFYGTRSVPIGCCYQEIHCEGSCVDYRGSKLMELDENTGIRIQNFSRRAVESLGGKPLGWIGIDWIQTPTNQLVAVEVNPRLTTSYLALRNAPCRDIASLWIDLANTSLHRAF